MKSIYEIRRENLRTILEDTFAGSAPALAEKLEFQQTALLYRYLSPNPETAKNIGSSLARKIERAADKRENWLDIDHSGQLKEEANPYNGNRPGTIDRDLLLSCMEAVRLLLIEHNIPRDDPAWTESSILNQALDLYNATRETNGRDRRSLMRTARNLTQLPVEPSPAKKARPRGR